MSKAKRFDSLSYNGPMFPPEYEPKGYILGGEKLSSLAEEMLYSCAHYFEHETYWPKLLKCGNFIKCLTPELTSKQKSLKWPEDYSKLFKQMQAFQAKEKERKAEFRKSNKAQLKAEKDANTEKYGFAVVDGKKAKIAGYLVEAPSVIITRGTDPRFGSWKYRVKPEDVTLNLVNSPAPKNWKGKIEKSPTSQWVFKYKVNCGLPNMQSFMQLNKKVNFAATTSIAAKNTAKKFEKTWGVLDNWKKIEKAINDGLNSKDEKIKQEALVAYLIAETGIRIGNEKDLDKFADTVGASTLKVENFEFK